MSVKEYKNKQKNKIRKLIQGRIQSATQIIQQGICKNNFKIMNSTEMQCKEPLKDKPSKRKIIRLGKQDLGNTIRSTKK